MVIFNANLFILFYSIYFKKLTQMQADYAELYLNTIYPALRATDTSRPFVPSSPSNGLISTDPIVGMWGNPYSSDYGDVHYYNYNDDCTNVTFFPTPRFASEFGFQSHPSVFSWLEVCI